MPLHSGWYGDVLILVCHPGGSPHLTMFERASNLVNDGTLDGFEQEHQEHGTACYPSLSNGTLKISK